MRRRVTVRHNEVEELPRQVSRVFRPSLDGKLKAFDFDIVHISPLGVSGLIKEDK